VSVLSTVYTQSGFTTTVTPPRPGIYYKSVALYNPLPITFSVQNGINQNTISAQTSQLFKVSSTGSPPVLTPGPNAYHYGAYTGPVQAVWFDPDDSPGSYPTPLGALSGLFQWTPLVSLGNGSSAPLIYLVPTAPLLSVTIQVDPTSPNPAVVSAYGMASGLLVGRSADIEPGATGSMNILQNTGDTSYYLKSGDNNGAKWTAGGAAPLAPTWDSLATDSKGTWVAIAGSGTATMVSTNNGATWTRSGAIPVSATWDSLATDSKGTWVAIAGGTATMVSTNNGATWTAGGAAPVSASWRSLATDSNGTWVAIAGLSSATMVSTNNGATWTAGGAAPSATPNWISLATDSNGTWVAIALGSTATMVSTNNGATWTAGGAAPAVSNWISLATDSNGTWVAIADGGSIATMVSTNNGATWTAGGVPPSVAQWTSVKTDSNGTWVAIAVGTATMVSTNNGATWTAGGAAPVSATWFSLATDSKGNWVAIAQSSSSTMVSSNIGSVLATITLGLS
jgi:hypothetical protein